MSLTNTSCKTPRPTAAVRAHNLQTVRDMVQAEYVIAANHLHSTWQTNMDGASAPNFLGYLQSADVERISDKLHATIQHKVEGNLTDDPADAKDFFEVVMSLSLAFDTREWNRNPDARIDPLNDEDDDVELPYEAPLGDRHGLYAELTKQNARVCEGVGVMWRQRFGVAAAPDFVPYLNSASIWQIEQAIEHAPDTDQHEPVVAFEHALRYLQTVEAAAMADRLECMKDAARAAGWDYMDAKLKEAERKQAELTEVQSSTV